MEMLKNLAESAGISSSYIDKVGKTHQTSDDVRIFFLNAMGFETDSNEKILESLQKITKKRIIEEVLAFYEDEKVEVIIKKDGIFDVTVSDEYGQTVQKLNVKGNETFIITGLDFGYYNLMVEGEDEGDCFIIYAPKYCYLPNFLKNNEHIFGVSLMIYALKSENSMGIGDFGDLEEIIKLTAKNGGDVVGLSPLGAMSPYTLPNSFIHMFNGDVSPYRTLSRLFLNYAYINLRDVKEFYTSTEVRQLMLDNTIKNEIKRLNGEVVEEDEQTNPLIEVSNHIKDEYVSEESLKIEIHKLINSIDSKETLDSVRSEIEDRFGKIDKDIEVYMYQEWFEKLAQRLGIKRIIQNETTIEVELPEDVSNKLEGDKLFLTIYNINPKFRLSYRMKKIYISLPKVNLQEHFIYYEVALLNEIIEMISEK